MSVYDIVFHSHNLLPDRHSTPSRPTTSPDAPGLILMAGAYYSPLFIHADVEGGTTMGAGHFWALSE
jgi:hypothetical protein